MPTYYSVKIYFDDTLFFKFLSSSKLLKFFLAQWFVTRSSKVYNDASISNAKNARIYSCNIH